MSAFAKKFQNYHVPGTWVSEGLGLLLLAASAAGAFSKDSLTEWPAQTKHLAKVAQNKSIYVHASKVLMKYIDTRIDDMTYPVAEKIGKIYLGKQPCPFVADERIVTAEDWDTYRRLDSMGIMPMDGTFAFFNVFAEKVMAEKRASHASREDLSRREEAKTSHLELSSLCVSFLGLTMNPYEQKRVLELCDGYPVYKKVSQLMPDSDYLGYTSQLHNDLRDLFKDPHHEKTTGIVSPSAVMADLALNGNLAELEEFMQSAELSANTFLPAKQLPETVYRLWTDTMQSAIDVNSGVQDTLTRTCFEQALISLPGPFVTEEVAAASYNGIKIY